MSNSIGIIDYLNPLIDEGYATIISSDFFGKKYLFKPSNVEIAIEIGKLVVLRGSKIFEEFEVDQHSSYIDINQLRISGRFIGIKANKKSLDFIIDHQLDTNTDTDLQKLRGILRLIDYKPGFPTDKIKINNIDFSKYEIRYIEGGYNKPGDYSNAWIKIDTDRPSNLPNNGLDKYLDKLFPRFDFTLGKSEDCLEYRFKNDILRKLHGEIGNSNIQEIKNLCIKITEDIKSFAMLVYNEQEHAMSLWHEYIELKSNIIKKYRS